MTPGTFPLDLYRGDSYAWRFVLWQDEAKTLPVDLTGATAEAEIRNASAGTTIVTLECTVVVPNSVDVVMTPAMYATCPKTGVWDLQITFPDGSVHTPIAGPVNLTPDVTDSVAIPAAVVARA
jgi:hypothetical protein